LAGTKHIYAFKIDATFTVICSVFEYFPQKQECINCESYQIINNRWCDVNWWLLLHWTWYDMLVLSDRSLIGQGSHRGVSDLSPAN